MEEIENANSVTPLLAKYCNAFWEGTPQHYQALKIKIYPAYPAFQRSPRRLLYVSKGVTVF